MALSGSGRVMLAMPPAGRKPPAGADRHAIMPEWPARGSQRTRMNLRNFRLLHLSWGIGTLGASLLLNGFAFVALFYLTTELGIAAALAGILIGGSKVWDAVSNPLMGWISDRTETRWGRRRPYLLAGAVVAS